MRMFPYTHEGRQVTIENGKDAHIDSIHQKGVYNGLMLGYPNEKINVHFLESARKWAKELCYGRDVYLIEPTQKPMERKSVDEEGLLALLDELGIEITETEPTDRTFEPFIALPMVVCCATLMYDGVFRDTSNDYSFLYILWFQDDYAFPIDADILEQIKQIPFGEFCIETGY